VVSCRKFRTIRRSRELENEITAHKSGTVSELPIAVGASVANGDTLAVISAAPAETAGE
jgi:pyruvate/2-oxoglutarate dehydrogenase complex dihydrolipoamide acyltransferase (E2) component